MPLLEPDVREVTTANELDSEFRPRAGSTGLRALFSSKNRQRNKSGDQDNKSGSPSTGSKMKNFLDAFRPRSKSDLSGVKKPKKIGARLEQSMDESHLTGTLVQSDQLKNSPRTQPVTPMCQILEGQMMMSENARTRHVSGPPTQMDQFYNRYRARSNSDSSKTRPPRRQLQHEVSHPLILNHNSRFFNDVIFT